MKETTVKLSGPSKDRFLERFLEAEPDLDPAVRDRLSARSKAAFTSLRVRKAALSTVRRAAERATDPGPAAAVRSPAEAGAPAAESQRPPIQTAPPEPQRSTASVEETATRAEPQAEESFDPYGFGLVPVFQREGRDGLLAKLATVTRVDRLRQMAKAQQIVIPQPLRQGDAAPDAVREAIVDAVAKRIADRRAAAG